MYGKEIKRAELITKGFGNINVSCQNARVNSTNNRVMKNQKTLSCSFILNRKNN